MTIIIFSYFFKLKINNNEIYDNNSISCRLRRACMAHGTTKSLRQLSLGIINLIVVVFFTATSIFMS